MKKTRQWTNTVLDIPPKDRDTTDYHFLFSKWMVKEEREKMTVWDLWINGLVCLKCKDFVRSRNRHDFRRCECWACAIDWGSAYGRFIWNPEDYIPVTESFTDV